MENKMTPPPINHGNEVEWLINVEGNIVGPLKECELVANGMKEDTLVYNKYLGGWEFARNIPVISYLFTGVGTHNTSIGHSYPAVPQSIAEEEEVTEENDIGHPFVAPFIGFISCVMYFFYMYNKVYEQFSSLEYRAMDYYSRASSGHSIKSDAIWGIIVTLLPAIVAVILSFVNAGYSSLNAGFTNDSAQRRSGAATAWGFAAILYVAAIFFLTK